MFKGFFNRLYNGNPHKPDVLPDDMPKNKIELFFACFGVNFLNLIKLNLLFLVFLLPWILWTTISFTAFNSVMIPENGMTQEYLENLAGVFQIYLFGCIPTLVLAGPPCAGLIYCAKRWAMDEHVWLWSDFKDAMKSNWKQAMLAMLILSLVLSLGIFAVRFYAALAAGNVIFSILRIVLIVLMCIISVSYLYIFPLMVSYELRFRDLLRNAVMLSIGRLPFTLLFTLFNLIPLIIGVLVFTKTFYALYGVIFFYALLGFALAAFVTTSYTNAAFDRIFTIEDAEEEEEEEPEEEPEQ